MVGQLLAFAGGLDSRLAVVKARAIVQETVTILEHTFPKAIRIRTAVHDDLRPVCADATRCPRF